MEVLVPDRFRAEVESSGTMDLAKVGSVAVSACSLGTPEREVVNFLCAEGWSRAFAEWLYVQAGAHGHDLRLKIPPEPILVTETKEFDAWALRKKTLLRRGAFWLLFGLLLRFAMFYFFGDQNIGGGDPTIALVGFVFSTASMLYGAWCVLKSKGQSAWMLAHLGAFAFFVSDKNKRSAPVAPRESYQKGSSDLSDW